MTQGYTRRKTRSQAQQEIQWGQRRFDGGQNSDTVASKIGDYDVALSVNTAHTATDIQGHWGRKLLSPQATPGMGDLHQVSQHPKTGRWLVHRGNKLWLSTGRDGTGWAEVTPIGPDGSLTAVGTFTDGSTVLDGGTASFLSNLVIVGANPGQVFNIAMGDTGGPNVYVQLYDGVTLVAEGLFLLSSQPVTGGALTEQGGSGISATVDINGYAGGDANGTATANSYEVDFHLSGLTVENTDNYSLYWNVVGTGTDLTFSIFKDSDGEEMVAISYVFGPSLFANVEENNDSGIYGFLTVSAVPEVAFGNGPFEVEFDPESIDIDARSVISAYGDNGFVVFIRGATEASQHNVFVEQRLNQYWFLSTTNGYGEEPISNQGPGTIYQYRYIYTFSRIVDPITGIPDSGLTRMDGNLQFEGPSAPSGVTDVDYAVVGVDDPISNDNPFTLALSSTLGTNPVFVNAAAYITHLSIYRTLDVGVNGVGINGAANSTELYGWIADVPISLLSYVDGTTDDVLKNNLIGASTSQDSLALRSRLFREMPKGIGAIGPDFMFTAAPLGQEAAYCDLGANPRLIGYYFPASQRWLTQDPICEIYRTKELFVVVCPSSTYTSNPNVQQETGIPGLIPVLTIQNFEPASRTLGIKYGQGIFPVDESSFITLLSDGTIRIFSAGSWSDALEGTKLHGITTQILPGAVFSFFRGIMLMWGRQESGEGPADTCLRYVYGSNNPNGSQWTEISRPYWAYPGLWCGTLLVEDYDSALRVAVFDAFDNAVFAVEDSLPLRQFEDDQVEQGLVISESVSAYFSDMDITYPSGYVKIYWRLIRDGGDPNFKITGYLSEEDRESDVLRLMSGGDDFGNQPLNVIIDEQSGSGYSATVDVDGIAFGDPIDFETFEGVVVSGEANIPSLIKLRELTGAQENYRCSHEESHIAFRPRYQEPALPAGLMVTVRGYADGILAPGAETTVTPDNSDIQFFAPVVGDRIQVEYETNKSGWRITSFDTRYNSQDMQADYGPWNGQESEYQEALDDGIVSWIYGSSGLVDRASPVNASYPGLTPEEIGGPGGSLYGQIFTTAVERAIAATLGDYTLMLWVLGPSIPPSLVAITSALKIAFPTNASIDVGGMTAVVSPTVAIGNGWQHFAVVRSGATRTIYQNGVAIGSAAAATTPVSAATMAVGVTGQPQSLCDVRLYGKALDAAVLDYYYKDVNTNEGRKVLPWA